MLVCDWVTILEIEPAIFGIFHMPVGTEITLMHENGNKYFVLTDIGEILGTVRHTKAHHKHRHRHKLDVSIQQCLKECVPSVPIKVSSYLIIIK